MIAFLHTLGLNADRFEKLVRKYDKGVEIKHFVNERLLDSALRDGTVDSPSFKKEIEEIRKHKPKAIICTCSTYGEECDKYVDVDRIDQPIAEYIVSNYQKIGLAYAAKSTQKVSENLLLKLSSVQNKPIEIINCDCTDHWIHFENKALDLYEKGIAKNIENIEDEVGVIFLAQASMEGAKEHLNNFRKEVFTSPEFGIKAFLGKYNAKRA